MDSAFVYSFVNSLNRIHSCERKALEELLLKRVPLENTYKDNSPIIHSSDNKNDLSVMRLLNTLISNACGMKIAVSTNDSGDIVRFEVLKESKNV